MASNNQQGGNKGNNLDNLDNQGRNNQSGNKGSQGFASMDPQKQREIASEGGRASHGGGNAQSQNAGNNQSQNLGNNQSQNPGNNQQGRGTQGGTPEQHAAAGRQSHKNDDKR